MTTVEPHRRAQLEIPSDAPSTARQTHSPPNALAGTSAIPPAVPSPPRHSDWSSPPRRRDVPTACEHEHSIVMESDTSSQWFFTNAEINSTPSALDKLPIAEERCRRAKGVNFIIQAGILLKLPQLTLATASVFFHRFFMRSSMVPERGGLHHYV